MATRRRKAGPRRRIDPLARERGLEALSRMRSDGLSLTQAARESHTTPETVRRSVTKALSKKHGRWIPSTSDRLTRRVWFLTKDGLVEAVVRGSRPASRVARHMAAVDLYLRTGSTDALDEFKGKAIRARGDAYAFITDPILLDRLAEAGEVSFERLYVLRS